MLIALALAIAALQAPPTHSTASITRTVIVDRGGLQAVRVRYAPGAVEPPGPHVYDVVIVPLDGAMSVELEGKPVAWRPGVPILIPRGAPHRVANPSRAAATFVSVRRLGNVTLDAPAAPDTVGVTVVRSAESKDVRATTVRFERTGTLRSPDGGGPSLFVLPAEADLRVTGAPPAGSGRREAGTVWLFDEGTAFSITNTGTDPFLMVRISAPASR
jgi:quercetin dioxygenase-like cupin family protein